MFQVVNLDMGILIITCSPGNEDICEEEVGNVLYIYDPSIRIVKTKHKGVLIVYTKLDPMNAFKKLKSSEFGFVKRIIPVLRIAKPLINDVVKAVDDIISHDVNSVCLKVRIRGIRGLSSRLWDELKRFFISKGIIVSNDASYCIYVEGVDDLIGVAFLRNGEDRVI